MQIGSAAMLSDPFVQIALIYFVVGLLNFAVAASGFVMLIFMGKRLERVERIVDEIDLYLLRKGQREEQC
jgi:hypothetical protein